jgi:hypothetical protein
MRAVNLIPSEQRTNAPVGAGRSQGGAYAVLVLILGLAGMAVLYGKADHAISSDRAQATSLTNQAQSAEAQADRLAPYTSFLSLRESRMQAVQTLVESRFDWAHAFHEFGRVLPAGTSISSLSASVGSATGSATAAASPAASSSSTASSSTASGSAASPSTASSAGTASTTPTVAAASSVSSSTPPGSVPTFTLAGCAVSQPAVAELLERLRLIDGVSEVELTSSSASSSGGGSGGGCPAHDPAWAVQLTFDPLPTSTTVAAATKTVSDAGTTAKTPAGQTGVGAR